MGALELSCDVSHMMKSLNMRAMSALQKRGHRW